MTVHKKGCVANISKCCHYTSTVITQTFMYIG